jgi:hypothetical protein
MKNTIIKIKHPKPLVFKLSSLKDEVKRPDKKTSHQTYGLSKALKIKSYLLVLLMLLSTGCSVVYVPALNAKITIENSDGDSKEKAIAYQTVLKDQGVESCVTCGVLSFNSQQLLHCWNEVRNPEDGRWKLVDVDAVVSQRDGWDIEQSPEYMPYIRYGGKVTVDDIHSERGFYWKSEKSIACIMENCEFSWLPVINELDYNFIFSPPKPQNFPRPPSSTYFAGRNAQK